MENARAAEVLLTIILLTHDSLRWDALAAPANHLLVFNLSHASLRSDGGQLRRLHIIADLVLHDVKRLRF